MAVDREAIFAALFTRLQTITGIAYFSRIWQGESELTANAKQTALIMAKGDERVVQVRGGPPRWELEVIVIILARVNEGDPYEAASEILNPLLTKLEAVLERQPTEAPSPSAVYMNNPDLMYGTTLGGLCTSVRFMGDITVEEGAILNQAVAIAPLLITTAG